MDDTQAMTQDWLTARELNIYRLLRFGLPPSRIREIYDGDGAVLHEVLQVKSKLSEWGVTT